MRLLVIAVNQEKFPYPVLPAGACRIVYSLAEYGHHAEFMDLMFIKNIQKAVYKKIKKVKPQAVLISIRNLDNGVLISPEFYLKRVKSLLSSIRTVSDALIIIGGTAFSSEPLEVFDYLQPDFGITGDGEESIKLLLNEYPDFRKLNTIPGLVYKINGNVKQNPPGFPKEFGINQAEALAFTDVKEYLSNGSYPGIQTRSGCPRKCIYCDGFKMSGKRFRTIRPDEIVKEIRIIKDKWKTDVFYFIDEVFSEPLDYAKELLKKIIKSGIKIKFEICDSPLFTDEEYISLLKKAGCSGVMFSIDAGSSAMLKSLKKGFTKEKINKTAGFYKKYNIPYYLTLLLGAPGENMDTLKEAFRFIETLPNVSAVLVNYGLRIQSETGIYNYCREKGLLKNRSFLKPFFYLSSGIKEREWNYIYRTCSRNNGWATYSRLDKFLIVKSLKYLKVFLPYPQWQYAAKISVLLNPVKRMIELFFKEYAYSDIKNMDNIIKD